LGREPIRTFPIQLLTLAAKKKATCEEIKRKYNPVPYLSRKAGATRQVRPKHGGRLFCLASFFQQNHLAKVAFPRYTS
jgi:hypothetical protein